MQLNHPKADFLATKLAPRRASGWLAGCMVVAALMRSAIAEEPSVHPLVKPMDLKALCQNADQIARGTVVDVREGSVQVGGGTMPTITYRIQVKEMLTGRARSVIEVTSVAPRKSAAKAGGVRSVSPIQLPELKKGQEYLLFTTRPSSAGLSTFTGLGQGCFTIRAQGGRDYAVNEFNNKGLGLPTPGPAEYTALAGMIRTAVAK